MGLMQAVGSGFLVPALAGLDRLLVSVLGGRDFPPPVMQFGSLEVAQGIFLAATVAHPPADELADDQARTADEKVHDHERSLPCLLIQHRIGVDLGEAWEQE
jgi:hypothetical protein